MGACCGARPTDAACSQLAAAGLLLSAADWALLRGRGVTGAAAVLASHVRLSHSTDLETDRPLTDH